MSEQKVERHENDLGVVETCECGGVHLTLGPMTLHLNADELPLLFELVEAAMTFPVAGRPDGSVGAFDNRGGLH